MRQAPHPRTRAQPRRTRFVKMGQMQGGGATRSAGVLHVRWSEDRERQRSQLAHFHEPPNAKKPGDKPGFQQQLTCQI